MQEIKKRRILLASVLKPVDEPRMFERMGQSLAANEYDVYIIGFPPSSNHSVNGIHFLPHKKFNRISVARIKVRFKILIKALSIKPDVLIISTHELIGVALLYRMITGKKIVYDVQENYWRNIMYTDTWPKFLRPLVAFFVRLKETISSPLFSKFLLAEKCYELELALAKRKSIVIENKCKVPGSFQQRPSNDSMALLFTGTIAESTGVFQAIELTKKLHDVNPLIRLSIIGQCAQPKVLKRIMNEISSHDFISLIAGIDFVSHEKVMEAIAIAHFGIIFYPPSPHTENKIPSKLYEYLACGLSLLLQNNKLWVDISSSTNSAIVIDFDQTDVKTILKQMQTQTSVAHKGMELATWAKEEGKLIAAINSL